MSLEDDIKARALELRFDAAGITDASAIDEEETQRLSQWLDAGFAGRMSYMERNFEKRSDPSRLLPGAQSVIVVGLNYKPAGVKTKTAKAVGPTGKVARYALYEDYHSFMKERLHKLARFINSLTQRNERYKVCVDSVPLVERALAGRAGLGFIGKNHMLINPVLGPEIFLGEIVTTTRLQADEPAVGSCHACSRCIDACPTGALRRDGRFDATRCISYLTIEHKGEIPAELAEKIGDRVFGCDECVVACPYQDQAPACKNEQFRFYPDRIQLSLSEILDLTEASFNEIFGGSPLERIGLEGLKRNARICQTNARRGSERQNSK